VSQTSEGQEDSAEFGSVLEDVQPEESEAPVEKSQNIEEPSDIEDDLEDQSLEKSSESEDETPEEEASDEDDISEEEEVLEGEEEEVLEGEEEAPSSERRTTVTALPSSPEEVVESLKRLRDDVGQISELSSEEGNLVRTFSLAFLKLMEPLAKNIPVDVEVLPRRLGRVERANIIQNGKLVLLHQNGRMESVDLVEVGNRDLLVTVVSDVLPKFKELVSERKEKIEKRITFLSEITRELQNIAESFATVT
jgi:hypothetical protein